LVPFIRTVSAASATVGTGPCATRRSPIEKRSRKSALGKQLYTHNRSQASVRVRIASDPQGLPPGDITAGSTTVVPTGIGGQIRPRWEEVRWIDW
jgi:hypothetical protein